MQNDEIKENLSEMLFNRDERLYNYITNLQQKYNEANNAINWWSNKAKELQQENEILRKNAEHNDKVVDKAEEARDYKSRCEKANDKIQYIIDYGFDYDGFNTVESLKGLIDMLVDYARESKNILQGEDNE